MYVSHVQIHVQYLFVQYYVRAWQHYPIGVYVLQLYSTDGMYMFPAHFSFGRVTALGVLCWFALLLLTFFLLHLSLTCIDFMITSMFAHGLYRALVSSPREQGFTLQGETLESEGGVYSCPFDNSQICKLEPAFQSKDSERVCHIMA